MNSQDEGSGAPAAGSTAQRMGNGAAMRPAEAYFAVGEQLYEGIEVFFAAPREPPAMAHALLCASIVECLLKAYLCHRLDDGMAQDLAKMLGNDLRRAWNNARAEGLAFPDPAPRWLEALHRIHGSPYRLRHMHGFRGFDAPARRAMAIQIGQIMEAVRPFVR